MTVDLVLFCQLTDEGTEPNVTQCVRLEQGLASALFFCGFHWSLCRVWGWQLLLLVPLTGPLNLSAFRPSEAAGPKKGRDFAGAAVAAEATQVTMLP